MSLSVAIHHRLGGLTLDAAFASAGGITAVFGASGCGKTSLVNVIAGLTRPDFARISVGDTVLVDTLHGIDMPPHTRRIGYVFQDARLFPHMTVEGNLAYGAWFTPRSERYAGRAQILDLLGIGHLLARRPRDLSGGEKQRVSIARALANHPAILLADEPTANLDSRHGAEVMQTLRELVTEAGRAAVVVTHDPRLQAIADRVLLLEDGRLRGA